MDGAAIEDPGVRQRFLTYLTLLFTLLFPVFGALWARSHVHDEALYRVGRGRAHMLTCVRGEVALWFGPSRQTGPVRYGHETTDTGYAMTAVEILRPERAAQGRWLLGFGYGSTYRLSSRGSGPVHCVAVPLWFLTVLSAAFPGRVLLRQLQLNKARADAELARCRRCGAELADGEVRCRACSFPAFVRQGVVA